MRITRPAASGWCAALAGILFTPALLFGWPILPWSAFVVHAAATFVPGLAIRSLLKAKKPLHPLETIISAPLGLAVFAIVYAITGATLGLAYSPVLGMIAANLAIVLLQGGWTGGHKWDSLPWGPFLIGVLVAGCLLALPYRNYGTSVGEYLGFPRLAVSDLFNHVSVTGELAKQIPPMNPYFRGEILHYYWLAHVIPSSFYRLGGGAVSHHASTLMACYLNSVLFLLLLTAFVWDRFRDTRSVYLAILLAVIAYSYADGLVLGQYLAERIPEGLRKTLFLDRLLIEQGETYSGMAHAWLRDFVVEPHATLALVTALAFWIWLRSTSDRDAPGTEWLLLGVLLASAFGQDAFVGLAFGLAGTGYLIWRTASRDRPGIGKWIGPTLMLAAAAAIGLLFFQFRMQGSEGGFIRPAVYWRMLVLSPAVLTIELGPTLLLGTVGILVLVRKHRMSAHADLLLLLAVSLLLMFFIRHDLSPNLFMRKSLKVIRIPFLMFAVSWLLDNVLRPCPFRRRAIVTLLVAAAVPTTLTDLRQLSRADGKGGSVLVRRADVDAFRWLEQNTPPDAVIQSFPDYAWSQLYTPVVVFADRRTAVGDSMKSVIYQVGHERAQVRADLVKDLILAEASLEETLAVARSLGIDYIYIGAREREKVPKCAEKFQRWDDHLIPVYQKDDITIYSVPRER